METSQPKALSVRSKILQQIGIQMISQVGTLAQVAQFFPKDAADGIKIGMVAARLKETYEELRALGGPALPALHKPDAEIEAEI